MVDNHDVTLSKCNSRSDVVSPHGPAGLRSASITDVVCPQFPFPTPGLLNSIAIHPASHFRFCSVTMTTENLLVEVEDFLNSYDLGLLPLPRDSGDDTNELSVAPAPPTEPRKRGRKKSTLDPAIKLELDRIEVPYHQPLSHRRSRVSSAACGYPAVPRQRPHGACVAVSHGGRRHVHGYTSW